MLPLTASALYNKPLVFPDGRLEQATLLPLFNGRGKVSKLLLVRQEEESISLLSWRPRLVTKPWFQAVRVNQTLSSLGELEGDEAWELTDLWHYDPWWLLTTSSLCDHPAAPAIKTTNAVDDLTADSLHFARDLGQVVLLGEETSQGTQLRSFQSDDLPPREEQIRPRPRPRGEWQLRPFWAR